MYGKRTEEALPWLSVVIPTFQRGRIFQEALESILHQTPVDFDWEILIVDNTPLQKNESTPALDIIRRLDDPRVAYYHNRENIGIGYNWNRCAELAKGKWICFLHDDDLLCPNALLNIGRQIRNYHGKKPLGYLHARRVDFTDVPSFNCSKKYPPERLTRFGVLLSGCTGAGSPTCGTTILRDAYFEAGGINYDFASSADAVLCYQIMRRYAVVCSDRLLGGCRWDRNETLKTATLLQLIQTDELLSKYTYSKTGFAAWWGHHFGAASSWRNIYRKQNTADMNGLQLSKDDFRAASAYPEPKRIEKNIFLAIYAAYRLLRLVDGWLQQIFQWTRRLFLKHGKSAN